MLRKRDFIPMYHYFNNGDFMGIQTTDGKMEVYGVFKNRAWRFFSNLTKREAEKHRFDEIWEYWDRVRWNIYCFIDLSQCPRVTK